MTTVTTSTANGGLSNTKTFTGLVPGSYSVTEADVSGWNLTGLTCSTGGTVDATNAAKANIVLTAGANVTCTYENTKQGSITIIKDAKPNDAQDFAFTTSGTGLSGFTLDDDGDNSTANGGLSNTKTFTGLVPGSYSVTEADVSGWNLTGLTCSTGGTVDATNAAKANIVLTAGANVTCTYENTKQGSITIIKDAKPNDAQDFAFTTSGTGLSGFTLDDDGDNSTANGGLSNTKTFTGLVPGSYSVTEADVSGWNLTGLTCSTGGTVDATNAAKANIVLTAGANVTCTYENTKQGSITIIKDAKPNDAQDFAFTTSGTGLSGFTLDDDGDNSTANGGLSNTKTFTNLVPGSYSVTEADVSGWNLTDLTCSTGGTVDATNAAKANIVLTAGANVTCTYENTKQGTITIIKDAKPNDAQDFAFTTSGTGLSGFTLDDDGDNSTAMGGCRTPRPSPTWCRVPTR